MPNHLHLCIQTAPETEIPLENRNNSFLSKQVGNVLSSYAQALNLQRGREGALYRSRFGRIKVDNRTYLKNLICYLNFNPLHHFDYEGCETYSYSSFPRYLQYASLSPKEAMREIITPTAYQTILTVFGGFENFLKYHEDYKQRKDQQLIETRMKSYDKQIVFSTNGDLAQLIL
jgi:hypothetical protein